MAQRSAENREDVVMKITIDLDEARAAALAERASRYGLRPDELVRVSVEELLRAPAPEFEAAVKRVIEKNADLYRRLA